MLTTVFYLCFLQLMVVMMLTYQPLIVGGIENTEQAKSNAWGALFTFVLVFVLSVGFLVQDTLTGGSSRSSAPRTIDTPFDDYDGLPSRQHQPAILRDYASSLDLPESVQEGVFS